MRQRLLEKLPYLDGVTNVRQEKVIQGFLCVKTHLPEVGHTVLCSSVRRGAECKTQWENRVSYFDRLKTEFASTLAQFNNSSAMQRLHTGQMSVNHYKSYLRQTFHYTKDNPQIQALATVHFRGSDREFVRMFYKHATSEIGHDMLALNDLARLGEDVSQIRGENALPDTVALNAFVFCQIYNGNPIGYLGYLFFLEFLPTSSGKGYMDLLEKIGVPREAMSFLLEHATVDVGHNRLMEKYVEGLIRDEQDFETVVYAMKVTGRLYANMLDGAFAHAENPMDWGVNHAELRRLADPAAATCSLVAGH